ncbi:MAG: dihydropteroate synthase [bacterium]|nr:dihydropteroate synthase [bacterium]
MPTPPSGKSILSSPREICCDRMELRDLLKGSGCDPVGAGIVGHKARTRVIRVDGLKAPAANILKQTLLSLGGDCAVHRDVILGEPATSTVHIVGTDRQLRQLPARLSTQPFALAELGLGVERLLDPATTSSKSLTLPDSQLRFGDAPLIMGILNLTPDSFSDGGVNVDVDVAVANGLRLVAEGAAILDLGGESTRPGAAEVTVAEEISRVVPVIRELAGRCGTPISIDTRKAAVAAAALEAGAGIVNDVSALGDPEMAPLVAESGAALVLMHMQGEPATMQDDPGYRDTVDEIYRWLEGRIALAVEAGIGHDRLVVDPGIGFGKRLRDNTALIRRLGEFRSLGVPVLLGASRKSFLGLLMDEPDPAHRLEGSLAAVAQGGRAGAQIVRVHDVAATKRFLAAWLPMMRKESEEL